MFPVNDRTNFKFQDKNKMDQQKYINLKDMQMRMARINVDDIYNADWITPMPNGNTIMV